MRPHPTPEIILPARSVEVVARPHPFSLETHRISYPAGVTILAIVGEHAVAVRVDVGGTEVPACMWALVRIKAGAVVVVTRFPQGGSAKTIFRLIAFAAIAIGASLLTAGLSNIYLGAVFISSTMAGVIGAAAGLVATLIVNALIPPSNPSSAATTDSTNLLNSITGTGNQITQYGPIPCVVGTILFFPPYAAKPYTEVLGDDQYLHCLFDLGYGDPDPAALKLGDDDLTTLTGVQTEIGFAPALFSSDILEEPANADMGDTEGVYYVRTTGIAADAISLDLCWSSGLFGADSNGKITTVTVSTRVEYCLTGKNAWQSIINAPGLTLSTEAAFMTPADGDLQVRNAEKKAVRVGVRWSVDRGQYDVRFIRNGTDWGGAADDSRVGLLTWTVLRTIRNTNPSTTGTKKLAVLIKASGQLSGNISQLSCLLSQPIPCWHADTKTWVIEYSSNPAYVYRWILRDSPASSRPIAPSLIDDDEIKEWGAECEAKDFTYSASIPSTTIWALLRDIAAAGRAVPAVLEGKYTVVRDVAQQTPIQVFTPRNSWGFSGTRAFPDAVHALRVQFLNPEANYQQDERIVYDDGYGDAGMVAANPTLQLATNFEQLTINGCTDADGAWRLGRYHLAVSRLRPNTYTWSADIESLVCKKGNLVMVASDVIGVGLAWGRVKTIHPDTNGAAIRLDFDQALRTEPGKAYSIRLRRQDATITTVGMTLAADGMDLYSGTLSTPVAGLNEDDLFCFGETGKDSLALIVTKIVPGADFSAEISAVDAAPGVQTADAGDVPAWSSQITGQPWLEPPPEPSFASVVSTPAVSGVDDSGNTQVTLLLTLNAQVSGKQPLDHTELRSRLANPVGAWTTYSMPAGQQSISITGDFEREEDYQLEARSVGVNGAASAWVQVTHTVGAAAVPLSVTSLLAYGFYYAVRVDWTVAGTQEPGVQYQIMRTSDDSGAPNAAGWTQIALIANAQTYTDSLVDDAVYWYRVRAVSSKGVTGLWAFAVRQQAALVGGTPPSKDPQPGDPVTQI